ncbi:MAG: Serine/threonine-protein kinase PrkC [Planctomycetota bacterium]
MSEPTQPGPVDPRRAEEVLQQALCTPPERRQAEIDRLCDGDAAMATEVRSLLAHLPDPEDPDDPTGATTERPLEGRVIGGCRVESLIGRGGSGRVFRAMQEWPPRLVALKVLRPELLTESARRRFRRETRALARLDHPGIARILSAGLQRDGEGELPWVAMELVDPPRSLTDWWRTSALPLSERLARFATLCDAVHHGHLRGLVHRDLKPSNVLVGADEQPKVIDFGVAAITADDGSPLTLTRAVAGTPGYMAPEQFEPVGGTDLRTDVHALGLLLFECLAGQPVFARPGLSLASAARLIGSETAPSLRSVVPGVDADLATIVEHALEKDPARRYQSASEMAADIRRHVNGLPTLARPVPALRRLQLFMRRNRLATAAVIAALASVLVGSTTSVILAIRARRAALVAAEARTRAEDAMRRIWIAEATRALEADDATHLARLRTQLQGDESWLVRLIDGLADESLGQVDQSHDERLGSFAAMACDTSPDGSVLAFCGDAAYGAALVDTQSFTILRFLNPVMGAWAITFDPVGHRLLMAEGNRLFVWERPWVDPPRVIKVPISVGTGIAASPDGTHVAVAGDGICGVVDLSSGRLLAQSERSGGLTTRVDWSPDGRWIAMGVQPGTVRLLHADDLTVGHVIPAPPQRSQAIAFDPTGTWLAFGGDDRILHVCRVQDPTSVRTLPLDYSLWGLDWHPTEPLLAVADRGKGVRLVSVPPGGEPLEVISSYRGAAAEVWDVDWAPDGSRLHSAGQRSVRTWPPRPRQGPHRSELGAAGLWLGHAGDGAGWALTADGSLWGVPADPLQPVMRLWQVPDFTASAAAGAPDHDRWAWVSAQGELVVMDRPGSDRATVRRRTFDGFQTLPTRMAISPNGRWVAMLGRLAQDPLIIVDAETLEQATVLPGPWDIQPSGLDWISNDRLAVSTFSLTSIIEPDPTGGWRRGEGTMRSMIATRRVGEDRIVGGSMSGDCTEFDTRTGMPLRIYTGVTDIPLTFAASPDGSMLVASGNDRSLRIFDRRSGEQITALSGHGPGRRVIASDFSPDGERVLTLDSGGTLLRWVPRPRAAARESDAQ